VLAILVPIGKAYLVKFISFGTEKKETAKKIEVPDKPFFKFTVKMVYNPVFVSTFTLDGVHFDTAKATLKPESYGALSDLIDYMTAKETAEIELSGHTDDKGDDQKNLELSQARAKAVKKYLVKKGIAEGRIKAVGYGETKPIAPNTTAFGRQQNRRTEVKILKE
jgi:outer membrane protein OmpA-like peptidoglycan-associated protein